MKKFYRIGEKLSQIEICGNDIKQYSIVIHSNRNLPAPTDAPTEPTAENTDDQQNQ